MNVQSVNYNPSFGTTVQFSQNAASYAMCTPHKIAGEIDTQASRLKEMGNDNMLIIISRIYEDMRDGLINIRVGRLYTITAFFYFAHLWYNFYE